MNEGTQQIIAKSMNIKQAELKDITLDNPDVFFVEYNLFSDYYMTLRNSTDVYVHSLIHKTDREKELFLTILMVAAATLILAYHQN
jgi:hypothetical protein